MAIKKIRVSLGRSVYSNKITQKKTTVQKLYAMLSEPQIREKKDGPYFTFCSYKSDTRNAQAVRKYYGATLDFDDTDMTTGELREIYGKWSHCIYSTHSHKCHIENEDTGKLEYKGNRYRIVIPYSDPVSAEQHSNATVMLMSLAGDEDGTDLSAKAMSRPMYLPACPKKKESKFYYKENKSSNYFDADGVELSAEQQWMADSLQEKTKERIDINEKVADGDRNNTLARLAGKFINEGMTLEDVMAMVMTLNEKKFDPPKTAKEVKTTVESVWNSHSRNNGDTDWSGRQIIDSVSKMTAIEPTDVQQFLTQAVLAEGKDKISTFEKSQLFGVLKKKCKDLPLTDIRKEFTKIANDKKKGKGAAAEATQSVVDFDIDELKQEYKHFFFNATENKVYNFKTGMSFKVEAFDRVNSHLKTGDNFNNSPLRILQKYNIVRNIDALAYSPADKRVFRNLRGASFLNTYIGIDYKAKRGPVARVLAHFEYLFPDSYERMVVMSFIGWHVQYPGVKFKWMPIIKGSKGVGKSIIADKLIATILGVHNLNTLGNTDQMTGKFNGWQTGAQLVVIQELWAGFNATKRQEITENMKSFITDSTVNIEKKGIDAFVLPNITNAIAFTNHEDCLFITPDERRFCMVRCTATPRSIEYYQRFADFVDEEKESILFFFENMDISGINPEALPHTNYTDEVIQSNYDACEEAVLEAMRNPHSMLNTCEVFTWTTLCLYVNHWRNEIGRPAREQMAVLDRKSADGRRLKNALLAQGFFQFPDTERVRLRNKRETVYGSKKVQKKHIDKQLLRAKAEFSANRCDELTGDVD